ncbi:hypothetical protein [Spongiimicrobium sp. 2-473A-2-J]|uniref:hypothetical protein n=1 Tax=Eudoraea algarum TaxID=3417568 RepID=UPI003D366368
MDWNLKSGVIVIGSLLWQDYLNEKGDDIRRSWREEHLDLDNKIPIKVPIRYGRLSRSGIATMVYSNRMKNKLGFAYLIPLKHKINNTEALIEETQALSVAEGMKGDFTRAWGVLTYLMNEERINPDFKKKIIRVFRQRKNAELDINQYKVGREKSCITKSLKLNIDWVKPIRSKDLKKLEQFDFLMATATKPKNRLLTFKEIANGIESDLGREYFINNIKNGIVTQEDFIIAKQMEKPANNKGSSKKP